MRAKQCVAAASQRRCFPRFRREKADFGQVEALLAAERSKAACGDESPQIMSGKPACGPRLLQRGNFDWAGQHHWLGTGGVAARLPAAGGASRRRARRRAATIATIEPTPSAATTAATAGTGEQHGKRNENQNFLHLLIS